MDCSIFPLSQYPHGNKKDIGKSCHASPVHNILVIIHFTAYKSLVCLIKHRLIWLFCHSDLPLSLTCAIHMALPVLSQTCQACSFPMCFQSTIPSTWSLFAHIATRLIHLPFFRPLLMLCSSEMPSVTTICNTAFSTLTCYFALSRFIFL